MSRRATFLIRYAAYIGFAIAALLFWCVYGLVVLEIYPFPVDRMCDLEGTPCPEPPLLIQILKTASIWLAIPLTVLAFIFFRRFVRRRLGYDDE